MSHDEVWHMNHVRIFLWPYDLPFTFRTGDFIWFGGDIDSACVITCCFMRIGVLDDVA